MTWNVPGDGLEARTVMRKIAKRLPEAIVLGSVRLHRVEVKVTSPRAWMSDPHHVLVPGLGTVPAVTHVSLLGMAATWPVDTRLAGVREVASRLQVLDRDLTRELKTPEHRAAMVLCRALHVLCDLREYYENPNVARVFHNAPERARRALCAAAVAELTEPARQVGEALLPTWIGGPDSLIEAILAVLQ